MATVVSVINLKGGVGKSTLTMILAEYLAFRFMKRVLLIDMDAQANLSYIMAPDGFINSQKAEHRTIHDFFSAVLSGQSRSIDEFVASPPLTVSNINRVGHQNVLNMVISSPAFAELDERLIELWEGGHSIPQNLRLTLKENLAEISDQYDIVLIDCPPGLSLFSSTALVASDFFVSPIIPESLSLEGVRLVQDRARELGRKYKSKIEFVGVIPNIVMQNRRTHRIVADRIYGQHENQLRPLTYCFQTTKD